MRFDMQVAAAAKAYVDKLASRWQMDSLEEAFIAGASWAMLSGDGAAPKEGEE